MCVCEWDIEMNELVRDDVGSKQNPKFDLINLLLLHSTEKPKFHFEDKMN
jgi:hypothetical protein